MKDIAEKAGVHVSTVSLALKDSPRIRESTRKQINEIAARLGYRPNPYLSTLMQSRRVRKVPQSSPVIGYVSFGASRDEWKSLEVEFDFFKGCQSAANRRGYKVEDFWIREPGLSEKRFSNILYNRGIQGLVLGPSRELDARVELDWERFSAVAIGYSLHSPQLHRVTNNHFLSTIRVMDYCAQHNLRRVGFVVQELQTVRLQHRWLGAYLAKRRELNLDGEIEPLITNTWSKKTLLDWFNRYQPEVIIGPFGSSANRWLKEAGIQIPQDVQTVSLACPRAGHEVTGIFENYFGIGAKAVQMVISMVEQTEKGIPESPTTLSMEGIWNPGTTVLHPWTNAPIAQADRYLQMDKETSSVSAV